MAYLAYQLTAEQREALLARFPLEPNFEKVCDHITRTMNPKDDAAVPGTSAGVRVVGIVKDEKNVALVVTVDGESARPHKGFYHITLGVDRAAGGKPVMSNALVEAAHAAGTAMNLPEPVDIGSCSLALKETAVTPKAPKPEEPKPVRPPVEVGPHETAAADLLNSSEALRTSLGLRADAVFKPDAAARCLEARLRAVDPAVAETVRADWERWKAERTVQATVKPR